MISSEVNTFSQQVREDEGGLATSSFVFSVPTSLREKDSKVSTVPRRSRSIPVGLDESDEEDIEVPRFTSLDYEEFECDSDGDLEVPRRHETLAERSLMLEHRMTTELAASAPPVSTQPTAAVLPHTEMLLTNFLQHIKLSIKHAQFIL